VDEGRAQTEAIHAMQRHAKTLEGMLAKRDRGLIQRAHRNAQRLLRPLMVLNPYAEQLKFVSHRTRTRRDHMKYLALIDSIALLHQYQRELQTQPHRGEPMEYVVATLDDIAMANHLAHQVLGRSLDELPPQTRRLLGHLDELVTKLCEQREIAREDCRFTRRQVREHTGWSLTQVRVHLERLVELESVLVHRGKNGVRFEYELVFDGGGSAEHPHLAGLVDVEALQSASTTGTWRGSPPNLAGTWRPPGGHLTGTWRGAQTSANPRAAKGINGAERTSAKNAHLGENFSPVVTVPIGHPDPQAELDAQEPV
jgi:DNA primase